MSAFSRGLGLGLSHRIFSSLPQTSRHSYAPRKIASRIAQAIHHSPIIQAARNLQTSARLHAAKRAPPAKKPTPSPKSSPPTPPQRRPPPAVTTTSTSPTGSLAMAHRLAARGKPTVLYQCPSHFWIHISSLSAAAFCIAYAVFHYWNSVMHPPDGLAWYVPHLFAVICLAMVSAGFWFLYSTAFIVRRITVIPKAAVPASYFRPGPANTTTPARQASLAALQESPVALDCEMSMLVPFLPTKRVIAAPSEVWLPFRFQEMPLAAAPAPAGAGPPHGGRGIMATIARPFKAFGRGANGAFVGLKRGLLREGFAPIKVKGTRYKVDVTGGNLFDRGRAVDALLPYRPEQFKDTLGDRLFK